MKLRRKLDEYGFGLYNELSLDVYKGGGKGGGGTTTVVEQPVVTPTPPVEDASIEMSSEQEDAKKKAKQGKGSLKIPLAPEVDTGLKV